MYILFILFFQCCNVPLSTLNSINCCFLVLIIIRVLVSMYLCFYMNEESGWAFRLLKTSVSRNHPPIGFAIKQETDEFGFALVGSVFRFPRINRIAQTRKNWKGEQRRTPLAAAGSHDACSALALARHLCCHGLLLRCAHIVALQPLHEPNVAGSPSRSQVVLAPPGSRCCSHCATTDSPAQHAAACLMPPPPPIRLPSEALLPNATAATDG
jgi:hypothetical protein